jgi:hypothetical protein
MYGPSFYHAVSTVYDNQFRLIKQDDHVWRIGKDWDEMAVAYFQVAIPAFAREKSLVRIIGIRDSKRALPEN